MRVSKWIAEPESWLEELNLSHIRQRIKLEDKIKVLEAENRVLAAEKRVALAQKAVIEEECKFLCAPYHLFPCHWKTKKKTF